jgi:hypothetical protein
LGIRGGESRQEIALEAWLSAPESIGALQPEKRGETVDEFDTVFTRRVRIYSSKFMLYGSIVEPMNSMILRARQMSLALLVVAVVDHGHLQADYSGASPSTSGLMRLGRDLMRLAGGVETKPEAAAADSTSSRNRRTRALTVSTPAS